MGIIANLRYTGLEFTPAFQDKLRAKLSSSVQPFFFSLLN